MSDRSDAPEDGVVDLATRLFAMARDGNAASLAASIVPHAVRELRSV